MKTSLLSTLEEIINMWVNDNCEGNDWPNVYVTNDMVEKISQGAAIVFDAYVDSQNFYRTEIEEDK